MSSAELANQLVFAAVGPFITSMWLAGDWGLTSAIFLIAHYVIRLTIFAQDTNMGWAVFNDLTAFWNFTMMAFLIVGAAAIGTIARLLIRVPNLVHIRKIFWTNGDRNQVKFLVPNNGTIIMMLVFALLAVGGTQVFHDIFIQESQYPLVAVVATPFIVAALYFILYFIMMWCFNTREGTALWGYDTSTGPYQRGVDIPKPRWSVMRRVLISVAAHHILLMVAIDITIIVTRDFMTTFLVAAIGVGVLLVIDIVLYFFYFSSLNDMSPYYNDWAVDLVDGALRNNDRDLDGVDDAIDYDIGGDNFNAIPMSRVAGHVPAARSAPSSNARLVSGKKLSPFASVQRM